MNPESFNRERMLCRLSDVPVWDVIVIGGGATGLGTALDAASRGYRTLLLEQADFAKGTSSRSTKLVHGGVRYLAQGNIRLVYESLKERGLLLQNAPHLVTVQPFIVPCYSCWSRLVYGFGLGLYDWMAGKYSLGKTTWVSREKVRELLPNIKADGLKGGVLYYDGQFDDARLAINLAQTCAEQGGTVLNYVQVTGLTKSAEGKVSGVSAQDLESGRVYQLRAKAVVNATGVYVDELLRLDMPDSSPLVRPSQGAHVVLDKSFLKGGTALMIPKTPDERVLFAIPWQGHVLVGTTDTPLESKSLEPVALETEIDFILHTAGRYLRHKPTRADVLSVFAGLRPLAASLNAGAGTKEISRGHRVVVAPSGLVTILGGKWTTYRKMAEDTVAAAAKVAGLPPKPCVTATLPLHGAVAASVPGDALAGYGSDAAAVAALLQEHASLGQRLHERFGYTLAEVVWAARQEMARTVEDVLARRMRVLFLDARAALEMAPQVAAVLAAELGRDEAWQRQQVESFTALARLYLPQNTPREQANRLQR